MSSSHLEIFDGLYNHSAPLADHLLNGSTRLQIVATVAAIGIISNLLLLVALATYREALATIVASIHTLFRGLAVSQIVYLSSYLAFTIHLHSRRVGRCLAPTTYAGCVALIICIFTFTIAHLISLLQMVLLSIYRFLLVRYPTNQISRAVNSLHGARWTVLTVFCLVPILCIPIFFTLTIVPLSYTRLMVFPDGQCYLIKEEEGAKMYDVKLIGEQKTLQIYAFWFHAIVAKILPSILMGVFNTLLIFEFCAFTRRHEKLVHRSTNRRAEVVMTMLILVVTTVVIVIELPHGILHLVLVSTPFHHNDANFSNMFAEYTELYGILTVVYSSTNFVIYCAMSSQFRQGICGILRRCNRCCTSTKVEELPETLVVF